MVLRRRQATALVAVMVTLLMVGSLAALLLTRSRATRRKFQQVERNLQRELALDAAFVHAFHLLREVIVDSGHPLSPQPIPPGGGELAGVPYKYQVHSDQNGRAIRIEANAGSEDGPRLTGHAVAVLKIEEETEPRRVRQTWGLIYQGPDPPEKEGTDR